MSSQNSYSCAIIGGGLAGLCLSIQLVKEGVSVILFEKEVYPFNKVCGEYISMESWDFLTSLNIPLAQMNLPLITNLQVTAPNGNSLNAKLPLGGFGISRYTLDELLVQQAKKLGVKVLENTKVLSVQNNNNNYIINTTAGTFTSNMTCGSWGKRSKIDVLLNRTFIEPKNRNLNNYIGIKYHIKAELPDNLISLHNFKNGYCGVSKVDGDKYCLCYLVKGSELEAVDFKINRLESELLSSNPHLKKLFNTVIKVNEKPLTISNISFEPKELINNGVIMLGDASGVIAPLCGNGMSMAMHASKILSKLLLAYFNNQITLQQLHNNYTKSWNENFALRLKTGRTVQRLFGKNFLTDVSINILKRLPNITQKIIQLTHGSSF